MLKAQELILFLLFGLLFFFFSFHKASQKSDPSPHSGNSIYKPGLKNIMCDSRVSGLK